MSRKTSGRNSYVIVRFHFQKLQILRQQQQNMKPAGRDLLHRWLAYEAQFIQEKQD
jgi:hypothetical protein